MTVATLWFGALARRLIADLAAGHSVSVTGISNSGKSTLMRSLAGSIAEQVYQEATGRRATFIYIDCNRAVAISAQAFYEVVLRSILERLAGLLTEPMAQRLRNYHESIIQATTAFSASLGFNLALTELCEQFGRHVCLLIDEFDELYIALDDRALLNLRALRDRFKEQLTYVTATVRSLPELRHRDIEDEFAEMFTQTTYTMPMLEHAEGEAILDEMRLTGLTRKRRKQCLELSGGHPGLLVATGQVLAGLPDGWEGDPAWAVAQEPQPRAECLKIWNQLSEEEQSALLTFAAHGDVRPTTAQLRMLEGRGLVKRGQLFSPVFTDFIARRGRKRDLTSTGVHLDPDGGDVYVDGIRIPVLTDLEFRLLALLDERRDRLTDKYQIVTAVWGENFLGEVDDARVEKLVSRLRSKIEADPANPRYLVTQRGRGYKLLSKPAGASTPGGRRFRKKTSKG